MRTPWTAAIAASLAVVAGLGGCGDDVGPGDRADVLRVVRAATVAEAADDARASCELMTTEVQRFFLSDDGDGDDGPRDTAACTTAYRRLTADVSRANGRRGAAKLRAEHAAARDAARDDDRVAITYADGHADVVVDAARGENADGYFRVEREDDRWRLGMYPETATLR